MKVSFKHTMYACFTGYIVQAIVNNFVPLLFLTFQASYGISITKITFLVTFNFGLQLIIDLISAGMIDRIGYRISVIAAHLFAAAGLIALVVLPEYFKEPFYGLLIAVMIYALGGGLIEVLISPIVEACPSDHKEAAMSLLHSFYCWGHVAVVLGSTLFFYVFGISNWRILALIWAAIPLINALIFTKVPIAPLIKEGERGLSIKELCFKPSFWLMVLLMIAAGASEQSVSQWASTLAEKSLGISKTLGDLTGPMLFAVMMGTARVVYSRKGASKHLGRNMIFNSGLCVVGYLLIGLAPWPIVNLVGCGICGFAVGILWPGTFSTAAAKIKRGGTVLFALLALAGDLGCALGPTVVGRISDSAGENLKVGILSAIVFPIIMLVGVNLLRRKES